MTSEVVMKKAVKRRWVKALRSGDYKQGRGALCNEKGGFCCLGVLADIEFDGYWVREDDRDAWVLMKPSLRDEEGVMEILPEGFAGKVGLWLEHQQLLAQMNDGRLDYMTGRYVGMASFEQIANWIEENL